MVRGFVQQEEARLLQQDLASAMRHLTRAERSRGRSQSAPRNPRHSEQTHFRLSAYPLEGGIAGTAKRSARASFRAQGLDSCISASSFELTAFLLKPCADPRTRQSLVKERSRRRERPSSAGTRRSGSSGPPFASVRPDEAGQHSSSACSCRYRSRTKPADAVPLVDLEFDDRNSHRRDTLAQSLCLEHFVPGIRNINLVPG